MNWHRSTPAMALLGGLTWAVWLSAPAAVSAQDSRGEAVPVLSDAAVVSVITVLPGDRLYSLFGHTIIRVHDPDIGLDVGFNFGTFDFPQTLLGGAGFVARFAYGKLDYMLGTSRAPLDASAWYWNQERRASIEQTLDLTPDQARSLFALLVENARPENRIYRYDFFFDNCSTRPRDVFETILGPELKASLEDPGRSFRQLLDPNLVGNPGVDLSMDIGDLFQLDAVTLKLNGREVAHHLYTDKQVDALYRGGIQKLFVGNVKQGSNRLTAFFTGRGPSGDGHHPPRRSGALRKRRR